MTVHNTPGAEAADAAVAPGAPDTGKYARASHLTRLREEIEATEDKAMQALLLHETGVDHEAQGEEPVAARDYLAAFNADAHFREPLEALVRILGRRKSYKNLAKLLDAMVRGAESAEDRARALWEHAIVLLEHDKNKDEARAKLEEAVAESPDDATSWLELELLAAEAGDTAGVMRAIEARAGLVGDQTYKALLFIQLAELSAKVDQQARAYEFLDAAAALEGRARFQTRLVLERVAGDDLEVLSRALEGQAELIAEVIDDEGRGEEIGVPRFMRTPEFAADAWLRAAEIRRKLGDPEGANAMLAQAAKRVPSSSVIARARLASLEAQGDLEAAAAVASAELTRGATASNAASLWLRVAEASAAANDRAAAVGALKSALEADPKCIPARAIELDLLSDGEEPAALASALEATAETFQTQGAKARAFALAGYVFACLAKDTQAAKASLSQAAALGLPAAAVARLGRAFASISGDAAWFEEATKRLLVAGAEADETASLWFELGRSRLLRGDVSGAEDAFHKLGTAQGEGAFARSGWLGRALAAFALGLVAPAEGERAARDPKALDALSSTESDPSIARGLTLAAALRAAQGGDMAGASERLVALHQASPADEVVAVFLAELLGEASNPVGAAQVLSACASASGEPDLAAALHVEAALLLWRGGERALAVDEMEAAREAMPRASSALLTWARRGVDADSLEGRRAAIDAAVQAGADPTVAAIERFTLEVAWSRAGGDADDARAALEAAESSATDDLAVAAALGRLAWAPLSPVDADDGREPTAAALELLEAQGSDGARIARAERHRVARDVDRDASAALSTAEQWFDVEPTLPVSLEWLGSALRAGDAGAEVRARDAMKHHLAGPAGAAMQASAAVVALFGQPGVLHPLIDSDEAPVRLMNVELAPPGSDPRRRAAALHGLGDALGPEAQLDAIALAAWSDLAAGNTSRALEAFKVVVEARPEDLAAWEGVRAAAEAEGDALQTALAGAQLGALAKDDARGGHFWEAAGLLLLEKTDAHDDAEIALERAFERNPRADQAFDKLFRRVRGRKEDDRLLDLIAKRLDVAEDETEIAKLFWERARVLQKRGDSDGALAALENVTMLEPDHVGALALAGTICIQKGAFAEAAPIMARLSTIPDAPKQERLVSGITACDLYENKLGEPEKALEVLVNLHREGLSTLPVRERLARAAARTGAWAEATSMLEQLMSERPEAAGRVEAARLAMAIWRDKVLDPVKAGPAVEKLLDEVPDDPEALELVLATAFDGGFRSRALSRGKQKLIDTLAKTPADLERVSLLAKIAQAQQDSALRQTTLGVMIALGKPDRGLSEELAIIDSKLPTRPQIVLDGRALAEIADPADTGPVAELFAVIAETVTLALGPSLDTLGVTKKNRVDAKGGPPIRLAVAEWMGALGFETDFELYVGGPDPQGVQGVAGEVPALVVGSEITAPFSPQARSAVAREVFALRRGICALRTRDDAAIASCVIAVCNEVGVAIPNPGYAVFGEVSRAVHKEISRKVKKAAQDVCQRFAQSGQDPKEWAGSARRSIDRMAAIAAGDVSLVLSEVLKAPRNDMTALVRENERAKSLLRFVLSPGYLELRKKLGMGVR